MPPMAAVNGDLERGLPNGSAGSATGPAKAGESSARVVRDVQIVLLCHGD
jgi:hypothetical protein